jgi:hypothetical protein
LIVQIGWRRKESVGQVGRLSEVPMDPWHPSTEVPHMQELSNRVKDLLQDVCRGFYRKLRVFYRMSLNCYRMSLNCYRMVYRGGLR